MKSNFKRSDIRKFLNESYSMEKDMYRCDCGNCPVCDEQDLHSSEDMHSSHPGEQDGPPQVGPDGTISPEELYHHFDVDQDGKVDMQDYAQHVDYHCEHPELLEDYLDLRDSGREDVSCHDSYKSCCDHLMSSTERAMNVISPLMKMSGGSCPASTASALADVLALLKSKNLI